MKSCCISVLSALLVCIVSVPGIAEEFSAQPSIHQELQKDSDILMQQFSNGITVKPSEKVTFHSNGNITRQKIKVARDKNITVVSYRSTPEMMRDSLVLVQAPYNSSDIQLIKAERIERASSDQTGPLFYSQVKKPQKSIPEEAGEDLDYLKDEDEEDLIADPLEPVNRVFFHFNDKLYFLVIKPVARGYSAVLPEGIRVAIRNFFTNIATPIRFVNNLLQLKFKSAGNELLRFGVNSTAGVLGLSDYAKMEMGITIQDEDFGQTLGVLGAGPVFYINLPVLGPSSVRDSIGYVGDYFLDPVSLINPELDRIAIKAGDRVNKTSLIIGEYEAIKKDAFDPYIAFRDIYYQYRKNKISE
jgi:phospholipid-binding lipoprotein MlaA